MEQKTAGNLFELFEAIPAEVPVWQLEPTLMSFVYTCKVASEGELDLLEKNASTPSIDGSVIDWALRSILDAHSDEDEIAAALPRSIKGIPVSAARLILRHLLSMDTRLDHRFLLDLHDCFVDRMPAGDAPIRTPESVLKLVRKLLEHPKRFSQGETLYDPFISDGRLTATAALAARSERILGQCPPEQGFIRLLNLEMTGIPVDLQCADTLTEDVYPDAHSKLIVSMPPLNGRRWTTEVALEEAGDGEWAFGKPPAGKSNFAWIQVALKHLSTGGMALLVVANDVLWSTNKKERAIKEALLEAEAIDSVISLPARLLSRSSLGLSLLILRKEDVPERRGKVFMIEAQHLGEPAGDGIHRYLPDPVIDRIVDIYGAYRDSSDEPPWRKGLCRIVRKSEILQQDCYLAPHQYVYEMSRNELQEGDMGEMLASKARYLADTLRENRKLDEDLLSCLGEHYGP